MIAQTGAGPWWAAVLVGIAGALVTLLVAITGSVAKSRDRRRSTYAEAVQVLIAWCEYPYRVRRRTSDDAAELARLRDLGHDLQEQLAYFQTHLRSDNGFLGDLYSDVIDRIKTRCRRPLTEAWQTDPATNGHAMVLNEWGPGSFDEEIRVVQRAVANRFGWRRILAGLHLLHPTLPQPAAGDRGSETDRTEPTRPR